MSVTDKSVHVVGRPRAGSLAAATGILTTTSVYLDRHNGLLRLVHLPRIQGIPILAISLLDLANSADFPANFFNERPVPHFAMALMALGGTFALVMTVVAFIDARRSWRNIKLLRQERRELLARGGAGSESSEDEKNTVDTLDQALLSLNQRDLRTEFFERAGMETFMGVAAFLVSVGTFLAIGGDNENVFQASNLLSGYIGNGPTAFYGLINTAWSAVAWHRARRQRKSALTLLKPGPVRDALASRTAIIERHAILSGTTCLVSGALGLLTPTYWEPYPVLLVCGLLFIYTTWVFRSQIAYIRPTMSNKDEALVAGTIAEEVEHLLWLQANAKKENAFLSRASFGDTFENSFTVNFGSLVSLGLFPQFCENILDDPMINTKIQGECADLGKLTPREVLLLDKELHPVLNQAAKDCMAKSGPLQVSVRIRFLLEALGTCLITSEADRIAKTPA